MSGGGEADVRADKWLWRARFFKTRSLAAKAVSEGLRINCRRTDKPGASVRPGDVLTFGQGPHVRVIEIVALGERRGPAPEAQALYADLSPPPQTAAQEPEPGAPTPGPRPDRRARREGAAARRGAP
ncbi:RNA-binding S4 domain-containing protein [Rubrimonas cliftonensis]|uniref:Heat shock protein Hsp15 n=1 Tax=Rubrimonas cliftonensis TaxID=89524 RepID=A0A1H4FBM2_9RHOB|nr:RNA-binding S4 domain-containing protein [Rubrimonas cliftonensis]SEA94158.1 heat shock protein Hsp15 [Rubrimonas cliftonensis]